jgi:leader peptidase (prepilin peptidase) / N-methyltransferase
VQTLAAPPLGWLVAFAALLGLCVGSFLNVVIHRLPRGESIVTPGSRCPGCGRPIRAWENIPVLSYLWLRGRCAGCGTRIAWRYPAIELLTGGLFAVLAARAGFSLLLPAWLAFAAALVAAAVIDFEHRIIPDEISVGGLVLALAVVPWLRSVAGEPYSAALLDACIGAALGGGLLWLVGFVHARVSAVAGRRFEHWPGEGESLPRPGSLDYWVWFPGVGFGDVKLLAMIGAVLGPEGVIETIVLASLAGLVLGLGFAAVTRRFSAPFGFGPAIAAGALCVLLWPGSLFRLL